MQLERNSIYKSFVALCLIFLLVEGYAYRTPLLNISLVYPVTFICLGYIFLNFRKLTIIREDLFLIVLGLSVLAYWAFHAFTWLEWESSILLRFVVFFCSIVISLFIKLYFGYKEIQAGISLLIVLSFALLVTQYLLSNMNVYWTFNIPLSNTLHEASATELRDFKIGLIKSNRYFSFFSEPSKIGFLYGLYLQICRSRAQIYMLILGIVISSSALGIALLLLYILGKMRFTFRSLLLFVLCAFIIIVTSDLWIGLLQLEYGLILKVAPRLITPWIVFLSLPLGCKYFGLGFGNIAIYDSKFGIDTSDLILPILSRTELYYSNTIVSILLSTGFLGIFVISSILIVYGKNNRNVFLVLLSIVLTSFFSSLFLLPEMVFLSLLLWLKRTR